MSRPPPAARRRAPGEPIRVLVADDSPSGRELVASLCDADPSMQVIAEVGDGAAAVERTAELRPDVVVMDTFMPGTDGFAATRRIMVQTPTPVILVSEAGDPRRREVGVQALQAGALAVLPKPTGGGREAVAFVAKVRALADVGVIRRYERSGARSSTAKLAAGVERRTPVELVAIAASTGGPAALRRMTAALPVDLGAPIVVVQHIVEGFTEGLVTWLDRGSPLPVRIAEPGARLAPGTVHVAPDGAHLEVTRSGRARLSGDPPVDGFRPSATRLFQSVAQAYGARAMAVVLTGMGGDGLAGVRAVRAAGGVVLAQDEASSVVFGMPGVVVREGLAEQVAPVERLAATIGQLGRKGHA